MHSTAPEKVDVVIISRALVADDVQSVVVVGAAKAAYDAVYLLLSMGKRVTWLIRPECSGPMPIMPAEMFGMNTIAVGSTRLMSYLSPSILNSKGLRSASFQSSILGRWVTAKFWDTITYLSDRDAGLSEGNSISALKSEVDEKQLALADLIVKHKLK